MPVSGLNAPGNRSRFPEASPARNAARFPAGAHPFTRGQYVAKFRTLADGVIAPGIQNRFLEAVTRLPDLDAGELAALALPGIEQAGEPTETWGIL